MPNKYNEIVDINVRHLETTWCWNVIIKQVKLYSAYWWHHLSLQVTCCLQTYQLRCDRSKPIVLMYQKLHYFKIEKNYLNVRSTFLYLIFMKKFHYKNNILGGILMHWSFFTGNKNIIRNSNLVEKFHEQIWIQNWKIYK